MSAEEGTCPCQQEGAACVEATEEELLAQLDDVLKEYVDVPGALIPVLQIAQAMFGYLPESALKKISLTLDNHVSMLPSRPRSCRAVPMMPMPPTG